MTGPFFGIPYEILIDCKKNKIEQRTSSQNGKDFLITLIYTQGSRIQKEKSVLRMVNITFQFSSVINNALIIKKIRWFYYVKSCKAQHINLFKILHASC